MGDDGFGVGIQRKGNGWFIVMIGLEDLVCFG